MSMPEFDWVLVGPDDDGLLWLEWADTEGKHSVCMGERAEAEARLHRILNPANDDLLSS